MSSPLFEKIEVQQLETILTQSNFKLGFDIASAKQYLQQTSTADLNIPETLETTIQKHLELDRMYFSSLKPLIEEFVSGVSPTELAARNPEKYVSGLVVPKYAPKLRVRYTLRKTPDSKDSQLYQGIVESLWIPTGGQDWQPRTVVVGNFKWHAGEKGEPSPTGIILKTLLNQSGKPRHVWGVGLEKGMSPKNFGIFWDHENPGKRLYLTYNAVMKEVLTEESPKIVLEWEKNSVSVYLKHSEKIVSRTTVSLKGLPTLEQTFLKESTQSDCWLSPKESSTGAEVPEIPAVRLSTEQLGQLAQSTGAASSKPDTTIPWPNTQLSSPFVPQ